MAHMTHRGCPEPDGLVGMIVAVIVDTAECIEMKTTLSV